ncbi:RICIN domain-containing protein [Massilia pseudoviolaceinigra]|uniref:RICIN domain-containing protein n=1 Tax=Massilia pseudoviolaceinigra TaxID=3057165 RepID=UPI002796E1C7|nr:RICIN domain-containing protein [Massilia sp. CCM 9206]MDQ1924833.1 RICIN domain-containing protein [Massilia sp. CCM 9206]
MRGADEVAISENWREMSICRSDDVNVNSDHNANDGGGINRDRAVAELRRLTRPSEEINLKQQLSIGAGITSLALLGMSLLPLGAEAAASVANAGKTYYLSASGNDNNDGASPSTPWKSLGKINEQVRSPGDKFLLKRGDVWSTQLYLSDLRGNGSAAAPIVISAYGSGSLPVIAVPGTALAAYNLSGYEISYLKFQNTQTQGNMLEFTVDAAGNKRLKPVTRIVNFIYNDRTQNKTHDHLHFHDNVIEGFNYNRNTHGLLVESNLTSGRTVPALTNLTIANNKISNVGWGVISTSAYDGGSKLHTKTMFRRVKINRNELWDFGSSGIVMANVTGGEIKWNYAHHGGMYQGAWPKGEESGPGGIWPISSKDIVMKFNEVHGMQDANSGYDGAGLNIDWYTDNVLMQYNYAHDNLGAGITTMQNNNSKIYNNKVENNQATVNVPGQISIMDFLPAPLMPLGVNNIDVRQNTVIVSQPETVGISVTSNSGGSWTSNEVRDNHIVLRPGVSGIHAWRITPKAIIDKVDGNRIYSGDGKQFSAYKFGTFYGSLADWTRATGFDAGSKLGFQERTPPSMPAGVSGWGNQTRGVELRWTESVDPGGSGVHHYNIHRLTKPNTAPAYRNMVGQTTGTSFVDTEELPASGTFYYVVQAEDNNGNLSPASSYAVVTLGQASTPSGPFDPAASYVMTNASSKKAVDVPQASVANGTGLVQYTPNGGTNQAWQLVLSRDGYHVLTNKNSRKVMEVRDWSRNAGAVVDQWENFGNDNQLWKIVPVGQNFKLINKNSGLALDVSNASGNGAALIQSADNGSATQQWTIAR